jgi:hypothetical protein
MHPRQKPSKPTTSRFCTSNAPDSPTHPIQLTRITFASFWRILTVASVAFLLMLVVGVVTPSNRAYAKTIEGVTFADETKLSPTNDTLLRLHGTGLLRYRVVFRGYVAALYLPEGMPGTRALDDVPRRLELSYFWSIGASDFAGAAEQFLNQNLSNADFERIRSRVETLHNAYRDVRPSDRYSLVYEPGVGTTLSLNGEQLATIPGSDFAEAYFGIWLGTPSLDNSLRDSLLNKQ